jgi:hypothetical protein
MDGFAWGNGQPWTTGRSAQAIDSSRVSNDWTAWTAFRPAILRMGRFVGRDIERGCWDVPSTLYAATDSPFL